MKSNTSTPESHSSHIPRRSQSNIPVLAPRQTSNVFITPSPHFGMVPPSIHLSVSGSPSHPSSPSSSTHSSTGGGLTPFRSFRNLLSFGPGKQTHNNANTTAPKSPFGSFSSIRRSINGERSVSSPQLRQERLLDESPVVSIDSSAFAYRLPKPVHEPLMSSEELRNSMGLDLESPELNSSRTSHLSSSNHLVSLSAPTNGTSDLSTILESEMSGISKHVPNIDDSQDSEAALNLAGLDSDALRPTRSPSLHSHGKNTVDTVPNSPATSVLDLSTSHLTSEVLEALSGSKHQHGWLHTVVVDDTGDGHAEKKIAAMSNIDPDSSFNLRTFDDDLATILHTKHQGSVQDATVLPNTSSMVPTHDGLRSTLMPPISLSLPPSPSAPTFGYQQSTVRRVTPLLKTAVPNLPSSLAQQRLTRSASDRPSVARLKQSGLIPPLSHHTVGRAHSHSPERPSTTSRLRPADSAPQSRSPSPALPRSPLAGNDDDSPRPSLSRPGTASRTSERPSTGSSRSPLLRHLNAVAPRTWDHDSSQSASRPSSSAGRAPSRIQYPRPSLDSSVDRPRPSRLHTRDRSASVSESQSSTLVSLRQAPSRTSMDWLGPRATHALRTAASLSSDKDTRAPSRFGSSRSSVDQDTRSRYAPSRMAFSEAGSSTSWGRHSESISRTPALSDSVSSPTMTESIGTPRSVFSAGFTGAAMSTSGTCSGLLSSQSELLQLQEKHSLETGVLLNALADSQRTTRVLREENGQLRERLQELEDRLASALVQLRRLQQHTTPSSATGQRLSAADSSIGSAHTHFHHIYPDYRIPSDTDVPFSAEPTVVPSEAPPNGDLLTRTARKRHSATSSLFPVLPSNMSMLMHEEDVPDYSGDHSRRSESPSSPTMVLPKLSSSPKRASWDEPSHYAGNISPTTANFSFVTGSPRSLNLRPEHERHLGDMTSLELDAEEGNVSLYNFNAN